MTEIPSESRARPRRSARASSAAWSLIPSTSMTARDPRAVAMSKFMNAPAEFAVAATILAQSHGPVSATGRSVKQGRLAGSEASTRALRPASRPLPCGPGDADRGRQSGRHDSDRDGLLDAYAAAAERLRSPMLIRAGALWRNPVDSVAEVGRFWDEAGMEWAVTSALSAAAWAPVMTEVTPMEGCVAGRARGG